MIRFFSERHLPATLSLGAALAILGSIRFLDREIAVGVWHLLSSHQTLHVATANIPDLLLLLVCIGTLAMYLAYRYLLREKGSAERLRFLQLAGMAVPAAYLLKAFLQFAFGRTYTRFWLAGGVPLQFDWFHGVGTGGFPSGHMTVFTAFGAAVWYVYPRCRRPIVLGLVLLGAALIVTDYHFLSDVIAGAYAGILLTCGILNFLKRYGAWFWKMQSM